MEHLFDFFEIGPSDLFFPLGSFLSRRRDHGARGQGEDLIERRFIGDQRSPDQSFSGLPQGGKIDLQKAGDSVVIIEAQSVSIRNGDQKKIEKDFQGREVPQKPSRDEPMVDPAEGTFDLSNSVGAKESFGNHRFHILASMMSFSFGQSFLSNEFWISRQEKVEKRNVISTG
jgi:hypothetical protein